MKPKATIVINEVSPGLFTRKTAGVSSYHDGAWVTPRPASDIVEYLESIDERAAPHIYLPGDAPSKDDNAVDLEDAIDYFKRGYK